MPDDRPTRRFDRRSVIRGLGAAGLAGLAGCGGSDSDDPAANPDGDGDGGDGTTGGGGDDVTEIVFWEYFGGTEQNEIQSLVEEFNTQHDGIQVEMSNVPFDNFFDAVFTAIASEDAPHVTTYWMSFSNYMVQEGAIDPIDEYMEVSVDDYYESAHPAMQVDGNVYALPMDIHGNMLISNLSVLEEAGVDGVPDDWESFQSACNAVKENTDARPFALMDSNSPVIGMRQYFTVLQQEGAQLVEGSPEEGWDVVYGDSEEALNAAQFVDDVTGEYEWDTTDLSDADERWTLFRDDELGMILGGNWMVNTLQNEDDEIPEDLEFTYSKPYVFPGGEPGTFGESTGYFFPSDPSHTEEERQAAVTFAEWITHNNPLWAQTAGHLPAAKEVGESDEVTSSDLYQEYNIVSTLAEMADAGEMVYHPRLPIDIYTSEISSPFVDVYAQNTDPADALESSASAMEDRLS